MKANRLLAGCLTALFVCLPFAGAADAKTQARQEDLNALLEILDTKHPDFYTKTTREQVQAKKAEIESGMDALSDFDFAIELSELAALGGDSHTSVSLGNALDDRRMALCSLDWMDGGWTLTGAPKAYEGYLGQCAVSLAGVPMDEVERRLAPMFSYDNEVYLRYQFANSFYVAALLEHYGILPRGADSVPLTVRAADGTETVLDIPVLVQDEKNTVETVHFKDLRKAVPATEPANAYYKLLDLGDGALYMQYNRCADAPDLPMADFAAEVKNKLASGAYTKFLIDLRNNGGGSDGVLYPVVYQAQQFLAGGGAVYALAGERTFSSALINTVQLKDIGAMVVGEPTGGSVDHFGSVTGFELPNSKLRGQYSNKFIDLGTVFEAAKPYNIESFPPDTVVGQKFADYLNGVDTAVQYVLQSAPFQPALTATATVSAARVTVDGKPVSAAAYNIGGSNYFKLRDLAMAFQGTERSFGVEWDGNAKTITLTEGPYKPVGGEGAALTGGAQTATRATAEVQIEDGDAFMPLVGKAYEIAGNHYFKLRDLCQMAGVGVEWDAASKTVRLTTK